MFDAATYQPIAPQTVTAAEIGRYTVAARQQTEGVGLRVANRSEFTLVAPVIQPDGPGILRERVVQAQIEAPYWENKLGTVHDLRVALINDDQQILFAATYSDEFKPYVLDVIRFATPWIDHMFLGVAEGYPGLASDDAIGYLDKYQVQADMFYGGLNPEATPRQIAKGLKVSTALDALLDATQD